MGNIFGCTDDKEDDQSSSKAQEEQTTNPASGGNRLLPGWTEYADATTGKPYYHNKSTGETIWDKPVADPPVDQAPDSPPKLASAAPPAIARRYSTQSPSRQSPRAEQSQDDGYWDDDGGSEPPIAKDRERRIPSGSQNEEELNAYYAQETGGLTGVDPDTVVKNLSKEEQQKILDEKLKAATS